MKFEHVCYLLYFNIKFAYMSPSVQHVKLSQMVLFDVCWNSGEYRGEEGFSKGHLAHARGDPGCGKAVCYPRHVQRGL